MADESTDQEKNLPPSERKLEQARESGSGLRAPDLIFALSVVLMFIGGVLLKEVAKSSWRGLLNFGQFWSVDGGLNLRAVIGGVVGVVGPFFVLLVFVAIVAFVVSWVLGGFIFSTKAISFDLTRVDPFKKIGEMFSNGGVKVFWPFAKGVVSLIVMGLGIYKMSLEYIDSGDLAQAILVGAAPTVVLFLVVAGLDLMIQIWQRNKQLSMTLQELKDEMKESEGDPFVKGKMRQIARQRSRRRMLAAVAESDVVVVNPDHYLVAMKWSAGKSSAPIVTAKARDSLALTMKAHAKECGVSVLEAPAFARALHAASREGAEIPAAFYQAVAVLLAWAFSIKDGRSMPEPDALINFDPLAISSGVVNE